MGCNADLIGKYFPDVSEDCSTYIFRVKQSGIQPSLQCLRDVLEMNVRWSFATSGERCPATDQGGPRGSG